ncbi:MAG: SRPBCC domain-containing protein, partial [Pseudomonadota bacterium]
GLFDADVHMHDLKPPQSLRLAGGASGPLGDSTGEAVVCLEPEGEGTRVSYRYGIDLGGKAAAIGGRMINGAARVLIGEFFKRLARRADPTAAAAAKESALSWASVRNFFESLIAEIRGRRS